MQQQGKLYVISAPSGAGKTSLVGKLCEVLPDIQLSISTTTRAKREEEEEGKDYHFVSHEQFHSMIGEGDFLEHAEVFGNYYGTSHQWVKNTLQQGIDVILEIDWQGARQVRKLIPHCMGVFILPPSRKILEQRLKTRAQDSEEVIAKRMSEAKEEISHYVEYDFIIVNDDFDTALAELAAIIQTNRLITDRQSVRYQDMLQDLLQ